MTTSGDLDLVRATRLLTRPRISIVTSHPDAEVVRLQGLLGDHVQVDGRCALERALGDLARARGELTPTTKTLDLIGHATPDGLLRLGDWVLDGESSTVTAFFRGIAELELLPRLGVHALRLLGCSTAVTTRARSTLKILSELLGLEVYGTIGPIYSLHYDESGFSHQWRFLLSAASEAQRRGEATDGGQQTPAPTRRALDIDALPLVALEEVNEWPRHVVGKDDARAVLELVDRAHGAQMPGLLAIPSHELALPSSRADHCHLAEVILDGQFLRVYPDGATRPGIVYPVSAPQRLLSLVTSLPTV
jgi:hypothetical protein